MRKQHGVRRENIEDWINQYTFQRRYLMKIAREEFAERFVEVLRIYFN
jgi:hypothetical protein